MMHDEPQNTFENAVGSHINEHIPPAQLRISRTGTRKLVGAPFAQGSQLKLYCVFAIQIGI